MKRMELCLEQLEVVDTLEDTNVGKFIIGFLGGAGVVIAVGMSCGVTT